MWKFLLGCVTISVKGLSLDSLVKTLSKSGIKIRNFKRINRTQVIMSITLMDMKRAGEIISNSGFNYQELRQVGFGVSFLRLLVRPVFVVGMIIIITVLIISHQFVMSVTYSGKMSEDVAGELKTICNDMGIYYGAYRGNWNINSMEKTILREIDELIFVSISINGIEVDIKAIEGDAIPKTTKRNVPTNIIARCSSQITKIDVYNGYELVNVGDVVRAKQLLVSAITPLQDGRKSIIGGAIAKIYGKVWYTSSYTKEFMEERVQKTGAIERKSSIKFMNKIIYSQETSFDQYDMYVNEVKLMKGIWPLSVIIRQYDETKREKIIISLSNAQLIAKEHAMRDALEKIHADSEIVSKEIEITVLENMVQARAIVETIEEIGVSIPIGIKGAD